MGARAWRRRPEKLLSCERRGNFTRMRMRPVASLFWLLPIPLAACAASRASEPVAVVAPAAASAQVGEAPVSPAPDHAVARSAVQEVVSQGLGMFLRRVDVDGHPVFVAGKFHGFRIAGLRDAQFWSGVDLKPGDVVTTVNGFPIERPEQAQTAFDSLEVASELRVAVERGGQPRELVYTIIDR
jgi:type II secretory pathway component PulC